MTRTSRVLQRQDVDAPSSIQQPLTNLQHVPALTTSMHGTEIGKRIAIERDDQQPPHNVELSVFARMDTILRCVAGANSPTRFFATRRWKSRGRRRSQGGSGQRRVSE